MDMILEELEKVGAEIVTGVIQFLPQLLKALLIMVMAVVLARVVVRVVRGSLELGHVDSTARALVVSIARFSVWLLAIAAVFWVLGLKQVSATLVGAGVLVAMATALASGVQGIISDVLAGVLLLSDPHFKVGAAVSVAGVDGIVEEVSLRKTEVRDGDAKLHVIPNRNVDAGTYVITRTKTTSAKPQRSP
jgi:small conductance mechanosensitive channel